MELYKLFAFENQSQFQVQDKMQRKKKIICICTVLNNSHLSRLSLQLFCTFAQNQLPGMLFLGVLPHSDVRPKHPLFFRGKWASSSPNTHPFGHHCCSQLCHHLRLPSKMNKWKSLQFYKVTCNSASYTPWCQAELSFDPSNLHSDLQRGVLSVFVPSEANAAVFWPEPDFPSS